VARAALLLLALLAVAAPVAADMTPAPPRNRMPPAPSAEQEYARGLAATRAREWSVAVAAFNRAVEMKPAYPEAWNRLGYALRSRGRYRRPSGLRRGAAPPARLPEALEYLGEAYVKMGRLDDARRVLERLKPLDSGMAAELAEAIAKGK
jgi:Flp pilus assembly protein TadD